MNKLSKLFLAAVLAVASVVPSYASEAKAPRFSGGIVHSNPSFIGLKQYLLKGSATATQIVDGDQGLLYGICRFSSTLTDYAKAFDYDTADALATMFAPDTTIGNAHEVYIMSPYVFSHIAPAAGEYTVAESVRGCWTPAWPIRFESGLIGKNNSTTGYSVFFYRLDDGDNPY